MSWSALLLAIAVGVITDEILCWSQRLAEILLRLSTHKLPPELRSRMHEEWLADLQTCTSRFSKLLFALDTFRAAYVIGHQKRLPRVSPIVPVVIRTYDLFTSLALLVITFPTIVLAAIFICFASRGQGPIVIRSNRIGRDSKIFCLYEFRTDDIHKNLWVRFVRMTHIDELLKIINVFKGDMNFVGPRPETPEFVRTMSEAIPQYELRHRVRPGITGYAQIRNPLSSTMDDAKADYAHDVEYIDQHYMLSSNLKILFETLRIVLFWEFGIKRNTHKK